MGESRMYVVLSRPSSKELTLMSPGARAAKLAEPPTVELLKLQDRDAIELRRDPRRTAAAAIPLTLIRPRSRGETPEDPGPFAWGLQAIGVDDRTLTGEGVAVAILDTGIDKAHEAFTHIRDRIVTCDFTDEGDEDAEGHGTHCAGIVFGRAVNGMRIGVAPDVQKALIGKVIGKYGASTATLMRGIQWALDGGAHVISMSLGIDFPGYANSLIEEGYPNDIAISRALEDYRDNLDLFEAMAESIRASSFIRQPTVVVAAAGNESRGDENPDYRVGTAPPAAARGFISVGAVGRNGDEFFVAPFSNRGPRLTAPGIDIPSARVGGGLTLMSGTSMATPHVAGAAALWAQQVLIERKRLSLSTLSDRLLGSAQTLPGIDPADLGTGFVQVPPSIEEGER